MERHHLRLLAHGLRTLQAIAAADGTQHGSDELPDRSAIRSWAADQPPIAQDRAFIEVLSSQLESAGRQLEQLAAELGRPPLSLELRDLIAWARNQANQRIAIISAVNLPP
ncbi:hypothetical protein KQ300_00900 [Synechococcus sp. CS-1331]|nr:hypothetical protein [Synechococcus sp. CS-1331]NQW38033.1 hypothetical protein [Cyanobacteria bacterium bin.275]